MSKIARRGHRRPRRGQGQADYHLYQKPRNLPHSAPTSRRRRIRHGRFRVRWFHVLALALLAALAWAGWQDYSTHGNIVPDRVVGRLLDPLAGLPDAATSGGEARSGPAETSSGQLPSRPPSTRTVPTATRRPTPTPDLSAEEREVLIGRMVHFLVNEVRANEGVPPLEYDVALAQVARNHSLDMVARDYYSHDNPDGESPSKRASRQGYHCRRDFGYAYSIGVAENIFHGYGLAYSTMPPAEVAIVAMKSWMGSSGHRANILDRDYSKEGVGVAVAGRTVYFTQNFC